VETYQRLVPEWNARGGGSFEDFLKFVRNR
jgi:hypothetical protein